MIARGGDAEECAGVVIIAAADALAVEVFVLGELAEGVVGHFLALALRQDAGGAAAHDIVFVAGGAAEGVGLGGLEAALVVGVAGDSTERIGHGDEAALGIVGEAGDVAFGIGAGDAAA